MQHGTSNIRSRPHAAVRIVAILLVAIASYVGASWYLWQNQRALIFLPSRDVRQSPADVGLKYEEVRVPVLGGQPASLHGWWLQSGDTGGLTFLYLHGNDLNIGSNVEHVARLNRLGFAVL